MFHSELSQLKSSSKDAEQFTFESLALRTAKIFLDDFSPDTLIQFRIFTNTLYSAVQLTIGKL